LKGLLAPTGVAFAEAAAFEAVFAPAELLAPAAEDLAAPPVEVEVPFPLPLFVEAEVAVTEPL